MLLAKEGDPFHVNRITNAGTPATLDVQQNENMIELIHLLEDAFSSVPNSRSAVEWAMSRSPILGDMKDSMAGKYRMVLQLCSLLQQGAKSKLILDQAIDRCSILVNLRKTIFVNRIRYSISGDQSYLDKAVGCFERYMFMLSLCSFLQEQLLQPTISLSFGTWLKSKTDVWNMLKRLRSTSPPLSLFRPVEDLSVFSTSIETRGLAAWGPHSTQPATELDKFVIKARIGSVLVQNTILKEDFWVKSKSTGNNSTEIALIKGASNFRKVEGFPVYGVAQPTIAGVKNVLNRIYDHSPTVVWINLREEPFIYINGIPYVLRDTPVTLRNLKSFNGISPSSLEILERKLKNDVIRELAQYNGKILLHSESDTGAIVPNWEECQPDAVLYLTEAMDLVKKEMMSSNTDSQDVLSDGGREFNLEYHRKPQTAESSPAPSDLDSLIRILHNVNLSTTSVILNCHIGMGRSTSGTIFTSLIMGWLSKSATSSIGLGVFNSCSVTFVNYQVIHSLLRVIRNGIECKRIVDQAIDACGKVINIRDMIEASRQNYETEQDPQAKEIHRVKGLLALERYFSIILFQNYLDQNPPQVAFSDLISFTEWLSRHPEFETIREELYSKTIDPLVPVNEMEPGDGMALTNEVIDVVNRRRGAVVSQGTIVKFDLFPGAQKMSLLDRIDGAHNFRRVKINELALSSLRSSISELYPFACPVSSVTGVGMPTKDGIRAVLNHVNAGPRGAVTAYWTSLREEPVLYIKGRPYVLRLLSDPIKNLVTTGIAKNRVEEMEVQMKKDMINDMHHYGNRVLLHEERVEGSKYLVVPVWETVKEEDIETPLDVYNSIIMEGYLVDYLRIPITDELSPIPEVFNQLVHRVLSIPFGSDPIFNCQMGRGRTTQGQVITYLMKVIVGQASLKLNPDAYLPEEDLDDGTMFVLHSPNTAADGVDASLEKGYKAGQYNLILQLIGVLQYGKLAKYLTDLAIDSCDAMQNLREAIYDYRIRIAALPMDSAKYELTFVMGCNYLVRYFYLITFADYLIEIWAPWQRSNVASKADEPPREESFTAILEPIQFSDWLETRREILNIIKHPNLD